MIKELINKDLVIMNLNSQTKEGVFHELAHHLKNQGVISNYLFFLEDIYERESLGSTGFGFGVAIPHAKSRYVSKPAVIFGKSKKGITYDSMDGKLVNLVFMIVMPHSDSKEHLLTLAWLSRKLIHEEFRNLLLATETKEEIIKLLEESDIE